MEHNARTKQLTRNRTNKAIRDGELEKKTKCESCGAVEGIQIHHRNYDDHLDVEWLCQPCHTDRHKNDPKRLIKQTYKVKIVHMSKDRTPILLYLKKNLEANRGKWPAIAREAGVSYSWVIHIMNGTTPNPQVNQVQAVVNVLWDIEDGKLQL